MTGESATLRGVADKVYWAFPTIVVQDSPDLIVLYMPAGVHGKNVDHKPATSELFSLNKINVVDSQWTRTDVLMVIVPGDPFSTYLMRDAATKELDCWYVNLQEPIRRTPIGFDTMDNMLDVVFSPDMSSWRWKDDDEFIAAQTIGFYSAEKAAEIWAEGERAIRLITKERNDLYKLWETWQADPEWELPILSSDWQRIQLP
jgi:hypothetical protein